MDFSYTNPSVRALLNPNSIKVPEKNFLKDVILSNESPIAAKLSAISFCRDLPNGEATEVLFEALKVHYDPLIRHEIIYSIGQAVCFSTWPYLVQILEDESEDFIVRHEAAEALSSMKCVDALPTIRKYLNHPLKPISDTCILSEYSLLKCLESKKLGSSESPGSYRTIDPIPPSDPNDLCLIDKNIKILNDQSEKLYNRYKSLFYFRDLNHKDSARIIGEALLSDRSSEVFRHECAFVLGQLQDPDTYFHLSSALNNSSENPMVRHESAISLGSLGSKLAESPSLSPHLLQTILSTLSRHTSDPTPIVSYSCLAATQTIEMACQFGSHDP